jgi:ABC-type amino acid transport substrate-binding protein
MRNRRAHRSGRRGFLFAASALLAAALVPAHAGAPLELQQPGALRIAVYADFPPYSMAGKGVDIALGKALAERLGLNPEIVEFTADEDMGDDLRNMVWRGHWGSPHNMAQRVADVMLHVPVDRYFAERQQRVTIFGPYHLETMAIARNPAVVPAPGMSAEASFAAFAHERIGAEVDTHGSDFLLHVLNGRLRDNVVHFRSVAQAVSALRGGEVSAVLATHTQLEDALNGIDGFAIDRLQLPEMRVTAWPLGMAVKVEHTALAAALAEALAELQRSGELARIYAAHGLTHRAP